MAREPNVAIVSDSNSLPLGVFRWALQIFQDKPDGWILQRTWSTALEGDMKLEASSIDALVLISRMSGFHTVTRLIDITKVLKPGGIVVAREPPSDGIKVKENLERNFLLAGYINPENFPGENENMIVIRAVRPMWETGISFSLKKTAAAPQGSTVKLSTFDVDNDYDLIDEDSLLTEDDLKRPELPKADDCEVGKSGRKACKNCTCGRADMEASGKLSLTFEEVNNPQSACGNCGLGDAFRCSTCPYKGLPSFKPGEKITLSGMLLKADV